MTWTMNKKLLAAASVAMTVLAPVTVQAQVPESTDPIRVAVNEWTGQALSANIAGAVLREMGYNVDLVIASSLPHLAVIAAGDLDVNPEIWDNTVNDAYTIAVASGDIVVSGNLGLEPHEGWVYPPYMEERCPGLPDYRALYDCAQAFSTAETFPNGRLIGYPADWGNKSETLVSAIGLPFKVVPGGSEGAMIAEIKGAIAAEEPILIMFWQPHWLFANVELNFVKFNESEGPCVEGSVQTKETACGFAQGHVVKIQNRNFSTKYPAAAAMMTKFTLTNAEQNQMILEVDQKGRTVDDVVQEWMTQNKIKWSEWIK